MGFIGLDSVAAAAVHDVVMAASMAVEIAAGSAAVVVGVFREG